MKAKIPLLMTIWLGVILLLIIIFVIQGKPFTFYNLTLSFFALVFIVLFSTLTYNKKRMANRRYFTFFVVILVSSGGVLTGLHMGLFESISVLEDSYIDLSNCAIVLHIKNTGLTDLDLSKVKIDDIMIDVFSKPWLSYLPRGEAVYLVIFYAHKRFQWYNEEHFWSWQDPYRADGSYNSSIQVTPLTFKNGLKYPITLFTKGMLGHNFE